MEEDVWNTFMATNHKFNKNTDKSKPRPTIIGL